jgi:Uma2 family endonuclease
LQYTVQKEGKGMAALPRRSTLSVEQYLELDRGSIETRYEYVDGHAIMMAGGTLDHAAIGANIISILRNSLRGSSCRVFTTDARVRISATRYFYPDVSVSCDAQDRGRVDIVQFPRLIVEVLSPSTEATDRGRKLTYYCQCPTVQEYMLINYQYPMVELYRREKSTLWTYHVFEEDAEVELASLGIRFPVISVYEDIVFPPEEHDDEPT